MKDPKIIGKLLEKYYQGETSDMEENVLREFFSGQDVPERFRADAELFGFFRKEREPTLSGEMESRLDRMIKFREPVKFSSGSKWKFYWMSAAAAVILILLGIFLDLQIRRNSTLEVRKDTFEDPYLAYVEAKRVLYLVSDKLNTGRKPLQNLDKLDSGVNYFHPVFSFGSGIQHLEHFSKIEETKKLISK